MANTGIAHHHRGTFPIIDEAAICAARRARYAGADAAYRAALGLADGEPLPSSIGSVSPGAGRFKATATGGRMRGRASLDL